MLSEECLLPGIIEVLAAEAAHPNLGLGATSDLGERWEAEAAAAEPGVKGTVGLGIHG